jgi:hypothetical protein
MSEPTSRLTPIDPGTMRPAIADVARLLRARTKDDAGSEVGTFTANTRPTDTQVEEHIDAAVALVGTHLPPLGTVDQVYAPAIAALVAYRAALQIEKSYYPEQVRSDRSAYEHLRQEYLDDLQALVDSIAASSTSGAGAAGHRAHSEWTPTFLRVFGTSYGAGATISWPLGSYVVPGSHGGDYWPEAENPLNWQDPLQPPREPPLPEDVPVGEQPTKGVGE